MSLSIDPLLALLVGILIGWLLEWLVELLYFRRRRMALQGDLRVMQARLRAREAELRDLRVTARSLQTRLAEASAEEWGARSSRMTMTPETSARRPRAKAEVDAEEWDAGLPRVVVEPVDAEVRAEAEVTAVPSETQAAAEEPDAGLPRVVIEPVDVAVETEIETAAVPPEVQTGAEKPDVGLPQAVVETVDAAIEGEVGAHDEAERPGSVEVQTEAEEPGAGLPEVVVEPIEAAVEAKAEAQEVEAGPAAAEPEPDTQAEAKADIEEAGEAADLPGVTVAPEVEIRKAEAEPFEAGRTSAELAAEVPQAHDDLTTISGIGPTYAGILRDHGITTYAQLAEADEDLLAEMIDAPSWRRMNYADWINQAREAVRTGVADKARQPASAIQAEQGGTQDAGIPTLSARKWGRRLVSCPQDLSQVRGVAQIFEERLYAAGIGTFWDLGHTPEEDLGRILQAEDFQDIDLEAIRADALRLARKTKTQDRSWDGTPPDDFSAVSGLSAIDRVRLFDAGICRYEALAAATVEQLAEICPASSSEIPDYASWIAQAKALLERAR